MPQEAAGAAGSFQVLMQQDTEGLERVKVYVDDVFAYDQYPSTHVQTVRGFLARLDYHDLKRAPSKACIGVTNIDFLGQSISLGGRPDSRKVSALTLMPMPNDISQLRSLLGRLS